MRRKTNALRTALFCSASLVSLVGSASAGGPVGGTVVAGQASISSPSSTATVIDQTSQRTIINWQSFSISSGSSVSFVQPNQSAIALNRVTGPTSSDIEGSLFANGQVWLINGNGILFGKGSRIDVGGLLATTADIANGAFMSGDFNFGTASSNPNAGVTNNGSVTTASGGSAVFAGAYASNNGLINANLGKVVLAGASTFRVDFSGDNLLGFAVTAPIATTPKNADGSSVGALASNSGTIAAAGGQVTMTARAATNVVDAVVNNSGMIDASSATVQGGEVILDAGTGSVADSGSIKAGGQSGGSIAIAGNAIALSGATLNATGTNGGGMITVGGTSTASVSADANTTLDASATRNGSGGTISVKAQHTVFSGTARARGGVTGGNGGQVETSGAVLDIAGARIDTSAPLGTTGTWTLDPEDVFIENAPTSGETFASNTYTPNADNSVINATDLETALATTNVTITTGNTGTQAGDITFLAPVTWASTNTLTLDATGTIKVDANVTITGGGGLNVTATNGEFKNGASIEFTDLIGGVPQGSLTIDGKVYTLLGTVAAVEAINGNLSGIYALAVPLDASSIANWTPIGSSATPFTGKFEGLGNTISNLTINTPNASDVGMFGVIGTNAEVRDFILSNASVTGGDFVGILAGENDGQVFGVYSSGTVTGVDFTDDGTNGFFIGGLVGQNTNMVDTSGSSANVAGFSVVGGLVGESTNLTSGIRPTIQNSFATGNVTGVAADANEISHGAGSNLIGGLVGQAATSVQPSGTASVDQTPLLQNDFATGNVIGDEFVGGLAGGLNSGEMDNSFAAGNVTARLEAGVPQSGFYAGGLLGFEGNEGAVGTVVSGSWASGAVSGDENIGGLVGREKAGDLITNSYATGSVTGAGPDQMNIGGLVGTTVASIVDSYSTGTVSGLTNVGGLVGFMGYVTTNSNTAFNNTSSSVTDVWTSSSVSGTTNVGGLVGFIQTGAPNPPPAPSIVGGYYDTTTSDAASGIGGGDTSASTVTGLTTSQMMTASSFSFSGGFGGLNSGATWVIVDSDGSLNNAGGAAGGTFPILLSEYSTKIFSAHQLQLMELDPTASYKLPSPFGIPFTINALGTAGGDVWGAGGFIPVGGNAAAPFTGTFDGKGGMINGLFIDDTTITSNLTVVSAQTAVGLFGVLGASGLVWDVALTNVNVSNLGTGASTDLIGALVGADNGGMISDTSVSGTVTADAGTQAAVISVGGLVGVAGNGATIEGSSSSADVISTLDAAEGGLVGLTLTGSGATILDSSASGIVTGSQGSFVGGLVGNASAGSISQSFSTATVDGVANSQIGGLVGFNSESISNSYATGSVSGTGSDSVGGLVGKSQGGTINQSYATGSVTTGDNAKAGGLVGVAVLGGTIENSDATGSVSAGNNSSSGGLIGLINENNTTDVTTVNNDFATGSVSAGASNGGFAQSGGLIGLVLGPALVEFSHASGAVSVGDGTSGNDSSVGGLIGSIVPQNGTATVTQSFATGSVSGGLFSIAGGLVGFSQTATIDQSYATGAVNGGNNSLVGGLIGDTFMGGTVENSDATGAVSAGNISSAGGLIGVIDENNTGDVTTVNNDFATGNVSAGDSSVSGGLVGQALGPALIEFSHASGAVSVGNGTGDNLLSQASLAGGLVGYMNGQNGMPTVTQAFATGSVSGGMLSVDGGLVGVSQTGTIDQSYATGSVIAGDGSAVGGLAGAATDGGSVENSYATGSVSAGNATFINNVYGPSIAGGLIGSVDEFSTGDVTTVSNDFATGSATAGASSFSGGLIGFLRGPALIEQSRATGAVSVAGGVSSSFPSVAGGLVGLSLVSSGAPSVGQSYATGAVTGGSLTYAGGLVGENQGSIAESYAMGAVSAGASSSVGGLIGLNSATGTVTQTFSTGYVTAPGGSNIGGLIGENDNSAGSITSSYYDMQTSGAPAAIGSGTSSSGATGETTAALQSGLPAGFSASVWSVVAGQSYPFLSWQFPSGTPQVVSGFVYSDSGVTPVGPGDVVNLLVNGSNPVTLTGSNLTVTGANGYYYFLLAPGTVPASNGQVGVYTKGAGGGEGVVTNANGSATGLPIWANTEWVMTADTTATQVSTDLNTLWGSSPDRPFLSSMTNLYGISTAASFTFDKVLNFTGTITIVANGPITIAPTGQFVSGAGGDAVTLVAPSFTNNAGSTAISITGGGRWLIYTNAPAGDSFGGLDSNNTAVWNTTYPTAIVQAGDRYVFAFQPVITVTSGDLSKTVGTDLTSAVASDFTITGLSPGVANAFLADTAASVISGTPDVTSLGSPTTATVSGSPYAIVVDQGTLSVDDGYALDLVSTGVLTVNPSPVTTNPVLVTFVSQPPSSTSSSTTLQSEPQPSTPPPDSGSTETTTSPTPGPTTSETQSSDTVVATAAPIASMTETSGGGDSGSEEAPESDGAATSIGESLDGHHSGKGSGTIIPGLLGSERQGVAKSANVGLTRNLLFSSWANDALWGKP